MGCASIGTAACGAWRIATMENDSIRSSGTSTLVDIWVEGKVRAISVSQAAIGAFLGFDEARSLS